MYHVSGFMSAGAQQRKWLAATGDQPWPPPLHRWSAAAMCSTKLCMRKRYRKHRRGRCMRKKECVKYRRGRISYRCIDGRGLFTTMALALTYMQVFDRCIKSESKILLESRPTSLLSPSSGNDERSLQTTTWMRKWRKTEGITEISDNQRYYRALIIQESTSKVKPSI